MHDHENSESHSHTHEHAHSHEHTHTHAHEHIHEHAHEHTHDSEHEHSHDQGHEHPHGHEHGHSHSHADHGHVNENSGDDALLKSKKEAAAFLRYTLQHNAHHEEELDGLVSSLKHLSLEKEAGEIASCIGELKKVNTRLEAVLAAL